MSKRVRSSAASLNWMGGLLIVLGYVCLAGGVIGGLLVAFNKSTIHDGGRIGLAMVGAGVAAFALYGALGYWARTYAATVLDQPDSSPVRAVSR